jgi:hypothetical protein
MQMLLAFIAVSVIDTVASLPSLIAAVAECGEKVHEAAAGEG